LASHLVSLSVPRGLEKADLHFMGFLPLVFLREKPDNQSLGSECGFVRVWILPRF
jgi:hypothetical protein